jgi:stage III sporulation protein AF
VEFLSDWVMNIILFILLATIIDMLLPNSGMKKYVKMVTGLLLIVIILDPLFKLVSLDFEQTLSTFHLQPENEEKNIENLIEMKKTEIQASNRAYILEQMAVQMKTEVEEELVEKYDVRVEQVLLSIKEESKEELSHEDISSIEVILSEQQEEEKDSIPVVKPIEIDTSKQLQLEDPKRDVTKIISFLATEWEIDTEIIGVSVEGGKE